MWSPYFLLLLTGTSLQIRCPDRPQELEWNYLRTEWKRGPDLLFYRQLCRSKDLQGNGAVKPAAMKQRNSICQFFKRSPSFLRLLDKHKPSFTAAQTPRAYRKLYDKRESCPRVVFALQKKTSSICLLA